MILVVTEDGLEREQPKDFKAYSVRTSGADLSLGEIVAKHPELEQVDSDHVAVSQGILKDLAGDLAQDEAWLADFDKMVGYASSMGWVTDTGSIVGHIEN